MERAACLAILLLALTYCKTEWLPNALGVPCQIKQTLRRGVKRTCRFAAHMSAYDPKRTSPFRRACPSRYDALSWVLGAADETARVYHLDRRCGCLAAYSECATIGQGLAYWISCRRRPSNEFCRHSLRRIFTWYARVGLCGKSGLYR